MELFEIKYNGWIPGEQKLREALCTLGNGYFATRGSAEESSNDEINYPGTYIAGGFNRAKSEVSGRIIENEDFVNFPNWLCLSFRAEGGEWLDLNRFTVHKYSQTLDMRNGMLIREFNVEDSSGRQTSVRSSRFVSMNDMHLAGIKWEFTPENWSGKIELRSALDGTVKNEGVDRYKELESLHLDPVSTAINGDDIMVLLVQTRQSRLSVALAASTRVYHSDKMMDLRRETTQHEKYIDQVIHLDVAEGQTYLVEKIAALYTSRDRATSEPSLEASRSINRAFRFMEILEHHKHSWKRLWRRADIGISGGSQNQQLLRLHIFHILQTVSPNTVGLDVGVPSRGLHGEAYRGHIFWDELYIFPFLNLNFPEITRSLLMYRYYRLDEARHAARQEGLRGAMFPWQSGSNGREESQILHLNPRSGRWNPDNTHLQRHVNAAIVYNVWKYYLATHDHHFFSRFGAEMILSIASFWESAASFNEERGRYEIHGVVGPDEYHTSYPGSEEHGLRNNAYTNVMVAWICRKALDTLVIIEQSRRDELLMELEIGNDVISTWDRISRLIYVPVSEDGIIEQFEGYGMLSEFPWQEYREKYGDISRLDRILESEGKSTNSYKAGKQADVLMLLYLFSEEELSEIFRRLDYNFGHQIILNNISYYRERTSHGSTLSRLVFSSVLSRYDRTSSWQNFQKLLVSDFEDIQGGTTPEGIHLGAMAGSLDLVQKTYAGVEIREDALWIKPDLPENIGSIKLRINYRLHWVFISVDRQNITISFEEGFDSNVKIGVIDKIHTFRQGETKKFPFTNPSGTQLNHQHNENSNAYTQSRPR
jgi:trehalose/maltose hydrolase-like predicted phosphorylase